MLNTILLISNMVMKARSAGLSACDWKSAIRRRRVVALDEGARTAGAYYPTFLPAQNDNFKYNILAGL